MNRRAYEGAPAPDLAGDTNSAIGGRVISGSTSGIGIQGVIQGLQDEQERVQKKTFTNWMNTYLCKRIPPLKVENLFEEIKDGVVLLSLLEVLSGDRLKMEKGPRLRRPHHIANITTALNYLEKKHIKLVNINATSVADGKPSIVLGLVWTIILYFQIEETISQVPSGKGGDTSDRKKNPALARQNLLAWTDGVLADKYEVRIKDFGKSWKDGVAFNAMIHNLRPDLVDMEIVQQQQPRVNLEHAFSTAETHLGIARLLDPEDVDVPRPDEKSIMTYVAQFLKAYPNANDADIGADIGTADKEWQAYNSIMSWLNCDAVELLSSSSQPVADRQSMLLKYIAFKSEFDHRQPVYTKIQQKILSGNSLKLTSADWRKLKTRWTEVDAQGRQWLLKLDSSLPGKLGTFGHWLHDAETMLLDELALLANTDDNLPQLAEILRQHKIFFRDLEPWKQFFRQTKHVGEINGESLDLPYLDFLNKRLEIVSHGSMLNQTHIEYALCRHEIAGYIAAVKGKVAVWMAKCGHLEVVESTLEDYVDIVETQHLMQTFDKTAVELRDTAKWYKEAEPSEANAIDAFQSDALQRCSDVAAEVSEVRPRLEQIIKSWTVYNACVDILTVWLHEGEQVLKAGHVDDIVDHFSDTGQYDERRIALNESGDALLAVVTDPVAQEIREVLQSMNRQCPAIVKSFHQYRQLEVVGKAHDEYSQGVDNLSLWLSSAQASLEQRVLCMHVHLKEYLLCLDELNLHMTQVENNFKLTTKTAQGLVKDSSQEVVSEMLEILNVQKELIVKLRLEIPERIKYVKAILPNVDSLETGVDDLEQWLEEGEQLLATHKLDGMPEAVTSRLEKHKAFFSETTYQKSILESKNKVYQKICGTKSKLPNIDFSPVDDLMNSANSRFQGCLLSSKEWDKKLEGFSRLWKLLSQRQQQVEEWFYRADAVINDQDEDTASLVQKHKVFFEHVDERCLQDYLVCGDEILKLLELDDQDSFKNKMEVADEKWKKLCKTASIKQVKLEFMLSEEKFDLQMDKAEHVLKQDQVQLSANSDIKNTYQKHQHFFQGHFFAQCQTYLDQMKGFANRLLTVDSTDDRLKMRYDDNLDRWNHLKMSAAKLERELLQIPERWKDYNEKFSGVDEWMNCVKSLMDKMSQECISSDEYRSFLQKFQKEAHNAGQYAEEITCLENSLGELVRDAVGADANEEHLRLRRLISRFRDVQSNVDSTLGKSSSFTKGFELRDRVDRRTNWLDEAQRLTKEDPIIDNLDDARLCLSQHEDLLIKLESEKAAVQSDIEQGKMLQRTLDAPVSIMDAVTCLDRKWRETNELAKAKHDRLKQKVLDWELYEGEKASIFNYLRQAEVELDKPLETLVQESAQKEIDSVKELQSTVRNLKGNFNEIARLNAVLCDGASPSRQSVLKSEVSDIDKRLSNVSIRLNAKLADLESAIVRWKEYYKRLSNFYDWLNAKESKLNEIVQCKQDAPENQLKKSEAISSQLFENHVTLENLEKDGKGLTLNFKARETAALKSKLSSLRRHLENLCTRAKEHNALLSGNLSHWRLYKDHHQQLIPWIIKAEKYCATDLPKCASFGDAKDLYDMHQAFLNECEENLPVFDKMGNEAGLLFDRTSVAGELDTIQKQWSKIIGQSEERSHNVDKMHQAWTVYTNQLEDFQDNLDRLQNRLSADPNISTTDVQILEHELALTKALQESISSQQPHLDALQQQFEHVSNYASPEGVQVLKSKQDSVQATYQQANDMLNNRRQVLNSALQHCHDFYGRFDSMEKFVRQVQRKLNAESDIYADEISDSLEQLKGMKRQCSEQDPEFQLLQQDFKDLVQNCSEEERAIITDRFDKLVNGYTSVEDLIADREELYKQWCQYGDAHKTAESKLKILKARLLSGDVNKDDIAMIMAEIQEVRRFLNPWSNTTQEVNALTTSAQVIIKDRATQRTLNFSSELKSLEDMCENATSVAMKKEALLVELMQLCDNFDTKSTDFLEHIHNMEANLDNVKVHNFSLHGIQDILCELENIRESVFTLSTEYEDLREFGRRVMDADQSRSQHIQSQLAQVNDKWDRLFAVSGEKHQTYCRLVNFWQAYNDAKGCVTGVLDEVNPHMVQIMTFGSQSEVKKALDCHKNAEFELHASRMQLNNMNTKASQLLAELDKVPGFQTNLIQQELHHTVDQWETANKVIGGEHKQNLDSLLVCWDQVKSGMDEVGTWITGMLSRLDDSHRHFDDAISVESRLNKFKEELPYYAEVSSHVSQNIEMLYDLNHGQRISDIDIAWPEIKGKVEQASLLSSQLSAKMLDLSQEQKHLQSTVQEELEWLCRIKDKLYLCDDVSGDDQAIIDRYTDCKSLQEDITYHKTNTLEIQDRASDLLVKFPSVEISSLTKDANLLAKKLDSVSGRAECIADKLMGGLEQRCKDCQQQQSRWISAAREKLSWCADLSGDRYSVDAKLVTMNESALIMKESEQRRDDLRVRMGAARTVLPHSRLAELEEQSQHLENSWESLSKDSHQTQEKLKIYAAQWKEYDARVEALSQWLKETESALRGQSSLQPDVCSKKRLLAKYKDVENVVLGRNQEFEDVQRMAETITQSSGDLRATSCASQLHSRFCNLISAVKEHVSQQESNVKDHTRFVERQHVCREWLLKAQQKLDEACNVDGDNDEDSLNIKLSIVEQLLLEKEHGSELLDATLESSEILYPTTSNEGRENIRRELRSLRDSWEKFSDNLTEVQRTVDNSLQRWTSFEKKFSELSQWMHDIGLHFVDEPNHKSTLQEKKSSLLDVKVRNQEISSHQSLVSNIIEMGRELLSTVAQKKASQLSSMYDALCSRSNTYLCDIEMAVDQHQALEDATRVCEDWMSASSNRLAVCGEATGDRHSIQTRLNRLEELIKSLTDGEVILLAVQDATNRTLPQTSPVGHVALRQQIKGLSHDWDKLKLGVKETEQSLLHAVDATETYDSTCQLLSQWLRETEAQFKDYEMRSTLAEKQAELKMFEEIQQQIVLMQTQFDELHCIASKVPGSDVSLYNYNSQLVLKYDGLKNIARDAINRWQEMVDDHLLYQNNYDKCSDWISTLSQRLPSCGTLSGDKQDVEDSLVKVHELIAERDEGVSMINLTSESGERLYPNTAAEGRDIVRQQVRGLREHWDMMCDELLETQRKLENNVSHWASYSDNFDTIRKWLLEVNVKLKDLDLNATLPEKKAQLQNHKVLHQDILSRKHVIDNLSEKAQSLTKCGTPIKLHKPLNELYENYETVSKMSKAVLERLEQAVLDHQKYTDTSIGFQAWLNTSRDRLEMCADRSGDKAILQSKVEQMMEFSADLSDAEHRLQAVMDLAAKTSQNTSPVGRDVLRRESHNLQQEWLQYQDRMASTTQVLSHTMSQWGQFHDLLDECADWILNMENSVKRHELMSSIKEKFQQVEKFKKLHKEILSYQTVMDKLSDKAQLLMQTTSDIRVSAQVAQLTTRYQALLSFTKDLVTKWEKMVAEHQVFDDRLAEYRKWIGQGELKLSHCSKPATDMASMEETRALIKLLIEEKGHGEQQLSSCIESGEKLFMDTSAAGRERVRQELRQANEEWDLFTNHLQDAERLVDAFFIKWSSFNDDLVSLSRWISDKEAALRSEGDLCATLLEKRNQLQHYRSLDQEVASYHRVVDSVVEKAHNVFKMVDNLEMDALINNVNCRYQKLFSEIKSKIAGRVEHVNTHHQYMESLQAIVHWMSSRKDKLMLCSDCSGDRVIISSKICKLQELIGLLPDGQNKLQECEHWLQQTIDTTAFISRQGLKAELDVVKLEWDDYTIRLHSVCDRLQQTQGYWELYEGSSQQLNCWLTDMEQKVKDFPLCTTLEEKEQQLKKSRELAKKIGHEQSEIDKFTDEAQTLQKLTCESRIASSVFQLASLYQALMSSIAETIRRCELNVSDHKAFTLKYADVSRWLVNAEQKFAHCSNVAGSRAELEDCQDKVQDLFCNRDDGLSKLNNCVESGEQLYGGTSLSGREAIRHDLRALRTDWDDLYDSVSSVQRQLDLALLQWSSFDESFAQIDIWFHSMEDQVGGQMPLHSTIEEKRLQCQQYKDVRSYESVMNGICDKAKSLLQSSIDPKSSGFISNSRTRYRKLCGNAEERVQRYEKLVANHHDYSEHYNMCVEWLNSVREKLSVCSDVSGDCSAIQSRLCRIQDILSTKVEGESKVKKVMSLGEILLPHTAPKGREVIVRDTDALRADWEAFLIALVKTTGDLESCMDQWHTFETCQDKCSNWIKDTERKLHDTELYSSLLEKQAQFERLMKLQAEVSQHQCRLDELIDSAQDLVRISANANIMSEASRLNCRYQTLSNNIKELCGRWERYVSDHEAYNKSYDTCRNWLDKMEACISTVSDTSGGKAVIQDQLSNVMKLLAEKDDGLHTLQLTLDSLQLVLPQTSVIGRDVLRRETQALQQDYDDLSGRLLDARTTHEALLSRWSEFEESVSQVMRWLLDLDAHLMAESTLQNTMQEKKLQLDRVKMLQANIQSQQSSVDSVSEKEKALRCGTQDAYLIEQLDKMNNKFHNLSEEAKLLVQNCEKNLRGHQVYRDSYMAVSDWLAVTTDKLNMCRDVCGDLTTVESCLHKVQEIGKTVNTGQVSLREAQERGAAVLSQTSSHGRQLVNEELSMLTADFDGFKTDLENLAARLDNLSEQWKKYESVYEELSLWIKDAECDMKMASELNDTLELKNKQLEKHTKFHEDLLQQCKSFESLTEQTQALMQLSADMYLTTQLSQISSRYNALVNASKNTSKQYERHAQDHHQYADAFSQAKCWLASMFDRLSECTETTAVDDCSIKKQMERLQVLMVMKEEGQVLVHSANCWGEKTMASTGAEGLESIRQELSQLQMDWDLFLCNVTNKKATLEACLLQWTDYSASNDKVIYWLKDMEKRLKDNYLKADLGEKKADLQRCKTLYQDIVSYERIVESLTEKAVDMAEKRHVGVRTSDSTANAVSRYCVIREQAKEMLSSSEHDVAVHITLRDCCDRFVGWLKPAVDMLATCSDVFGEKSAIESKIEKINCLNTGLHEGKQRLIQAGLAGEATSLSTSHTGQTRIRQELETMNKQFDDHCSILLNAQTDLEVCLARWEEFEAGYLQFSSWLRESEVQWRAVREHKVTVDDKKRQLDECQSQLTELLSHRANLDEVSDKAQRLLQTNADAKTSHAITQLNSRYQAIVVLARNSCGEFEEVYVSHIQYNRQQQLFGEWLHKTRQHIHSLNDVQGSRCQTEVCLGQLDNTKASLDRGHHLLRCLLDGSEKIMASTSIDGCKVLRKETESAKASYEDVISEFSKVKRDLDKTLLHWAEFDQWHQQVVSWIDDAEQYMDDCTEYKADLPDKRSCCEKYKALQSDIEAHGVVLDKLRDKAGQMADDGTRSQVSLLYMRYGELRQRCKDALQSINEQVSIHQEYRKSYIGCLDWLVNSKQRLHRLSDFSGDKHFLKSRLQQLREFQLHVQQGQDVLSNCSAIGEQVCSTTATEGQPMIRQELQALRVDWVSFSVAVSDDEKNLENCITSWQCLEDEQAELLSWIEHMNDRVNSFDGFSSGLFHKRQFLQEGEVLYSEITSNKLELLHERADAVFHRSCDPRVSNNVVQIYTKYQALCSLSKNMVSRLKGYADDHEEYDKALAAACCWLRDMADRVAACSSTAGDCRVIQDRYNQIKGITISMDEGLSRVNYVYHMAEKVLPTTSIDGKKHIECQITEMTSNWEKLSLAMHECVSTLEQAQNRWREYEQYYDSLVLWLNDTEGLLNACPESKSLLVERKAQLDKYKLILTDIENRQHIVDELAERAAILKHLCNNAHLSSAVADVQTRLDSVRTKARDKVEIQLRQYNEHCDFDEAQQDCDKWLLQMSFRLMSHNSLYVSSMEFTERQIENHRSLLVDIADYQHTMDSVNDLGHRLILSNVHIPALCQQVQSQLHNLEESYRNLRSSGRQIKDQLNVIYGKWKEYKNLLESTNSYLSTDFPQFTQLALSCIADNLTELQKKREETQFEFDKLQRMKHELQQSAQHCENHVSAEITVQHDGDVAMESTLAEFADNVNRALLEATNQLEGHLDRLREMMHKWDNVDRSRVNVRNLLRSYQKRLKDLQNSPTKLHSEAATLDVHKIQHLRTEVASLGSIVDDLLAQYHCLTQHNPALADPVVLAVHDDWEELLGQIDLLLASRQSACQSSQHLQTLRDTMDEELENYAHEMYSIDQDECTVKKKAMQMQACRKRCRSTQTRTIDTHRLNLRESHSLDTSHGPSPRGPSFNGRPSPRFTSFTSKSFHNGRSTETRSPKDRKGSNSASRYTRDKVTDLSKGASTSAVLESDSEESGYGDTYGETMHTSTFDTHLDDTLCWNSSDATGKDTPASVTFNVLYESDDSDSGASYISVMPVPADRNNLRDTSTQTPGFSSVQSMNIPPVINRSFHTQTDQSPRNTSIQTSMLSTHSVAQQTKRSGKRRIDLLRSILMNVRDIKRQHGMDNNDDESIASDSSICTASLGKLNEDVTNMRAAGAKGDAVTQTAQDQMTQTVKLTQFENDIEHDSRQERLQGMMFDVRNIAGAVDLGQNANSHIASHQDHSTAFNDVCGLEHRSPAASVPHTVSTSLLSSHFSLPSVIQQNTADGYESSAHMATMQQESCAVSSFQEPTVNDRSRNRSITDADLDAITERINRLENYQIPSRLDRPSNVSISPDTFHGNDDSTRLRRRPRYSYVFPARRYMARQFTRSYDDIDALSYGNHDGGTTSHRRHYCPRRLNDVYGRYHLDDALDEATNISFQLKRMSSKMRHNLNIEPD